MVSRRNHSPAWCSTGQTENNKEEQRESERLRISFHQEIDRVRKDRESQTKKKREKETQNLAFFF